MATYILFSGRQYYPEGGADDSVWVLRAESDDDALNKAAEQEGIEEWWKLTRLEESLIPILQGWSDGAGRIQLTTAAIPQ